MTRERRYTRAVAGSVQGLLAVKPRIGASMKRLIYVGFAVFLSGGLSAFGAAQLVLGLGLESDLEFEVAILAAGAAFAFNFFLINGLSHNSFS
jgi:hypothetical protein